MGILDEAIREHLELKRQHGAGDSELKKLEDEAFGPPERPDAEPSEALAEALAEAEEEAPAELIAQPEEVAEELPPRRRAPDIADLQEAPSTEERQAIAEAPTELYDVEGAFEEEPSVPSGEDEVEGVEEEDEEDDDDFFNPQRLSDELDQALEAPDEDMLEETPDFLEEAPEDDQLWFEQKPPKDFDFDD